MPERTMLGIAGSVRSASHNRAALRAARGLLPSGWRLEILDLEGIPPFSRGQESRPPHPVIEMKQRIRAADAILFATPEHSHTVPGVLTNAIDWAARPHESSAWQYKPVAILGASVSGLGTVRAQLHLRQICISLDMHPVHRPEVMISEAARKFDSSGALVDARSRELIRGLLASLAALTDRLAGTPVLASCLVELG